MANPVGTLEAAISFTKWALEYLEDFKRSSQERNDLVNKFNATLLLLQKIS